MQTDAADRIILGGRYRLDSKVGTGGMSLVYRATDLQEDRTVAIKMLREEYAQTVMSLGVFLSACFFNESPYIEQVVMSGFTSVRNKDGDLVDQYLYSVKYTRDVFEQTDLSGVEDLYGFILRFENRINLSSASNFKPVTPYEMESVAQMNAMVMEMREPYQTASKVDWPEAPAPRIQWML